jgi:hypothetical protein
LSLIVQAVLAAFPCAWGVGVLIARLLAGPDIGALPALIIPLALAAAIASALVPVVTAVTRRNVLVGGAIASFVGMYLFV